ncbi:MAG: T9SS type A sorting domain-containing protein, partial [Flavobacteriales bacterium]
APNKIIMFAPQENTNNIVSKPTIGQAMSLFPNPAGESITVEAAESLIGSELTIFNSEGKPVEKIKLQSSKQLVDISQLPAGSYWTVASSALGTVTRTFVKTSH